MSKERILKLKKYFNIALSIMIVASGFCLILGCLDIYFGKASGFSRETVVSVFSTISIPIYICLLMIAISLLWEIFFPDEKIRIKNSMPAQEILKNLSQKKDFSSADNAFYQKITDIQKKRQFPVITRNTSYIICSILFFAFSLNPENYSKIDINSSIITMMFVLIPCLLFTFASTLYCHTVCEKSYKEEANLIKTLKSVPKQLTNTTDKADKTVTITRSLILIAGIILIVFGVISGGTADVLTKAVNICTECIGLG